MICGDSQSEPSSKKPALENASTLKIGTHNGSFHCDEALACFLLKCLPKYAVSPFSIHLLLYCLITCIRNTCQFATYCL